MTIFSRAPGRIAPPLGEKKKTEDMFEKCIFEFPPVARHGECQQRRGGGFVRRGGAPEAEFGALRKPSVELAPAVRETYIGFH